MSIEVHRPSAINDTLVGFQQEPNGRGTLTILFSCVLTLSLCVWSALHLDIPRQDESSWAVKSRYLKWSVMGLLGPELLIWVAWRQYISAHVLSNAVQEVARFEKSKSTPAQQWTSVHSFYVGMGGFVFDLTDPELTAGAPFIPDLQRLHVTPRGAQLLAQCGFLPSITKDDIVDKSKTDGTGKVICCLQVGWMIVSAITRTAVRLPVSPLEVNTLAHVVCALLIYVFWWNKPRWVNEPTVLRGQWTRPLCAFMYMSSQVSAKHRSEWALLRNFGVKTELANVLYTPHEPETNEEPRDGTSEKEDESGASSGNERVQVIHTSPSSPPYAPSAESNGWDRGRRQQCGTLSLRSNPSASATVNREPEREVQDAMCQIRWQNCCEAISQYDPIRLRLKEPERDFGHLRFREALQLYPSMPESIQRRFTGHSDEAALGIEPAAPKSESGKGWVCMSEELVVGSPRNWPGDDLINHMQGHLMGMIMWASTIIYGAVHLAGWNEQFPTLIELWFWRASALYVVFSGLLWTLLNLCGHVSGPVWVYWYDFLASDVRRKSHVLIYVSAFIGGSLYVVARVFLVVEAFISLRALPASVYASPSWILAVPHIG